VLCCKWILQLISDPTPVHIYTKSMKIVFILCVTVVMAQMNFDFQVPKRFSHRVTTSPPTLYASTADAEMEGSGLSDVAILTWLPTAKRVVVTPGDMSAYFTTPKPTTIRIVTTEDWKQKLYSYGQYAKEIRQRRNQMFTSTTMSTPVSSTTTEYATFATSTEMSLLESETSTVASVTSFENTAFKSDPHHSCIPSELFADGCIPLWLMFTMASLSSGLWFFLYGESNVQGLDYSILWLAGAKLPPAT
jgi:hypothetical protein